MWEIKELVRVMVHEWGQVVSYQNPLPCQMESLDANPETGEGEGGTTGHFTLDVVIYQLH